MFDAFADLSNITMHLIIIPKIKLQSNLHKQRKSLKVQKEHCIERLNVLFKPTIFDSPNGNVKKQIKKG